MINSPETIARNIRDMTLANWPPRCLDIAMLFEHHDATTQVYSLKRGSIGVIERIKNTTLCFWLNFDEHNSSFKPIVTGWRYAVYRSNNLLAEPITRGGRDGNWYTVVANDIAITITQWLGDGPMTTEQIITHNIAALANRLGAKFQDVDFEIDMDAGSGATVPLDEESDFAAFVEFDNIRNEYHVEYMNNDGNTETHVCVNFDELVASLIAHGAQPRT